MGKRRRSGFGIGSLVLWFKPCLYVLSIPGYLDDGASWVTLFRLLYGRMTPLDWGLIGAGAVCAAMAFWPEKQRATSKAEPDTEPGLPESPPVTLDEPRVVTTVDPEESQASQGKGHPLIVQVCVTIENGLDVDVRLSKLELDIELKDELLACRFAHFQRRFHNGMDPNIATHRIEQYDEISVPPRQRISGWVCFKHDVIRISDFKRFVFTVQAIGEPKQVYKLEPYDWAEATNYKSSLVWNMP